MNKKNPIDLASVIFLLRVWCNLPKSISNEAVIRKTEEQEIITINELNFNVDTDWFNKKLSESDFNNDFISINDMANALLAFGEFIARTHIDNVEQIIAEKLKLSRFIDELEEILDEIENITNNALKAEKVDRSIIKLKPYANFIIDFEKTTEDFEELKRLLDQGYELRFTNYGIRYSLTIVAMLNGKVFGDWIKKQSKEFYFCASLVALCEIYRDLYYTDNVDELFPVVSSLLASDHPIVVTTGVIIMSGAHDIGTMSWSISHKDFFFYMQKANVPIGEIIWYAINLRYNKIIRYSKSKIQPALEKFDELSSQRNELSSLFVEYWPVSGLSKEHLKLVFENIQLNIEWFEFSQVLYQKKPEDTLLILQESLKLFCKEHKLFNKNDKCYLSHDSETFETICCVANIIIKVAYINDNNLGKFFGNYFFSQRSDKSLYIANIFLTEPFGKKRYKIWPDLFNKLAIVHLLALHTSILGFEKKIEGADYLYSTALMGVLTIISMMREYEWPITENTFHYLKYSVDCINALAFDNNLKSEKLKQIIEPFIYIPSCPFYLKAILSLCIYIYNNDLSYKDIYLLFLEKSSYPPIKTNSKDLTLYKTLMMNAFDFVLMMLTKFNKKEERLEVVKLLEVQLNKWEKKDDYILLNMNHIIEALDGNQEYIDKLINQDDIYDNYYLWSRFYCKELYDQK